jgi:hypothetical protein
VEAMFEQTISWWNEPALAHWNCCDFSSWQWFLDRLLPYAPLITAAIAVSAGIIALLSIRAQKKIARRRAAIDLFLKTDLDAAMLAAYGSFNANITALQNPIADDDQAYKNVRDYLNIHHLIAVGIDNKVFDERVCFDHWSGVLVRHCEKAEKVIVYACESNNRYTYYHLKRRNKKWARRLTRWTKWHDKNGKLRWPYWPSATAIAG